MFQFSGIFRHYFKLFLKLNHHLLVFGGNKNKNPKDLKKDFLKVNFPEDNTRINIFKNVFGHYFKLCLKLKKFPSTSFDTKSLSFDNVSLTEI